MDLQTCLKNDTSEGHATRKQEVGRRLALAARVAAYGEPPTDLSFGPLIVGVSVETIKAALETENASLLNVTIALNYSHGLHHADVPECAGCCKGATGPLIQVCMCLPSAPPCVRVTPMPEPSSKALFR